MRKSRFSEEKIIGFLKEVESGSKVSDVCRRYGVSEQTYFRWKRKYGGLDVNEARRLKSLEEEIRRICERVFASWPRLGLASVIGDSTSYFDAKAERSITSGSIGSTDRRGSQCDVEHASGSLEVVVRSVFRRREPTNA